MPKETWKPVVGYEGIYEVSDLGRIKSLRRRKPKILSGDVSKEGYRRVWLLREKTNVARIVLRAFVGKLPKEQEVNHKNGKPSDNRLVNIEYCTRSENLKHSFDILGRDRGRGENGGNSKITAQQVLEIWSLRKSGMKQRLIAKRFGISQVTISAILHGRIWAHLPKPFPIERFRATD